jgi:hypothetical protein
MTSHAQIQQRLLQRFQEAHPILFTGAGFSCEARDVHGRALPVGPQLASEIWAICYPDTPYDGSSSLSDVYQVALLRHPKALKDLLLQRLNVSPKQIPRFYETYFSLPWRKIYTLNIDNLAQAAAANFPLPVRLYPLSAVSDQDSGAPRRADHIDVIHLNGTLDGIPDKVTFSTLQYAARQSAYDAHYDRLAADLLSHQVVFVGTQLDEADFWKYIELRRVRNRGSRELRPNSLLITKILPQARQQLLEQFNVDWIAMSAAEFAEQFLDKIRGALPNARIQEIVRMSSAYLIGEATVPRVSQLITESPTAGSDFLAGQEPIWADITTERAAPRTFDTEVLGIATDHLSGKANYLVVNLVGTAGAGKSTSLMRLCARLSGSGYSVGYVARHNDLSPRAICKSWDDDVNMRVLAIDDADRYASHLASIVRCVQGRSGAMIVLTMRAHRVSRVVTPMALDIECYKELTVPHLTDVDIDGLLDCLDRANRLGRLKGMTPQQRREELQNQAGRQLLVAMIQATSGQRFEDKVIDEYRQLDASERFMYACLAVATERGSQLSREQVVMAMGDASNEALNLLDGLVRRSLVVAQRPEARGGYMLRHREIARLVFVDVGAEKQAGDVIGAVAWTAAQAVGSHVPKSSRAWRLVKELINHDYLQGVMDLSQARDVYSAVESLLRWDFHFWLQRGSLELEKGDTRFATQYLDQAKSLNPDDPYVQTEYAYLEFKRALESPGRPDAVALADSAIATLEDLIRARGEQFPHAYHVLGSQGMAWARKAGFGKEPMRALVNRLIAHLVDGCRKHPFSEDLLALRKSLERELLSLAVR